MKRLAKAENIEWLAGVYGETSGYIHLSGKHVFSTLNKVDTKDRKIQFKVGATDSDLPQEIYVEAVDAFIAATKVFMNHLAAWGVTKTHIEEVARMRKDRGPQ